MPERGTTLLPEPESGSRECANVHDSTDDAHPVRTWRGVGVGLVVHGDRIHRTRRWPSGFGVQTRVRAS